MYYKRALRADVWADVATLPPGGCVHYVQEEEVFRKWTRQSGEGIREKGGGKGATERIENDKPSCLLAPSQNIIFSFHIGGDYRHLEESVSAGNDKVSQPVNATDDVLYAASELLQLTHSARCLLNS